MHTIACRSTVNGSNSLTSPPPTAYQSLDALLRDGVPLFNQKLSHISQCGGICHSIVDSPTQLVPQVFNGIEVRAACWPLNPLYSSLLEIIGDYPCSVWVDHSG